MTLEFLNPNTYTFAGGLPVKSGRDLIIPDSMSLSMATINNPSSGAVDLSAITAAISAGSAAEVAAINDSRTSSETKLDALYQQQGRVNRKVAQVLDSNPEVTGWSQNPSNHIVWPPDSNVDTLAIEILNTSDTNIYWDTFIDIRNKTSTPHFDNVMSPGGSIRFDGAESSIGLMLYQLSPGAEVVTVSMNIQTSFPLQ